MSLPALCIGGASSVWRDIERVERVTGPWPGLVIAVNDVGADLPRLDCWGTLHPARLLHRFPDHPRKWSWKRVRQENGFPDEYTTWAHTRQNGIDYCIRDWARGSSGLLAVGIAMHFGCDPIILCGIRMDPQRNAYREEGQWQHHSRYRRGWTQKLEAMKGRVWSMSGWTRSLLGEPDDAVWESIVARPVAA